MVGRLGSSWQRSSKGHEGLARHTLCLAWDSDTMIQELVVQVVQDKVTSIPNKAAEELQNMVVLRLQENVKLDKELESIEGTPRHRSSEQNIPIK